MHNLAGSTAVLIGAGGGIGPHIARVLASEQVNLVLASRSQSKVEEVAAAVRLLGIRAIVIQTDVTDGEFSRELIRQANREFGAIDVLVYNAGVETVCHYQELHVNEIENLVRVNLVGPMLVAQAVLPGMASRRRGHIVNISSLSGKIGPPYIATYAATKAGLIRFTQSLRSEYRGTGISASVVCPGFVTTGMNARMTKELGTGPPRCFGLSSPEAVAKNVLNAIRNDVAEILVNPGPMRLLMAVAELFPSLANRVVHSSGLAAWYENIANARSARTIPHENLN